MNLKKSKFRKLCGSLGYTSLEDVYEAFCTRKGNHRICSYSWFTKWWGKGYGKVDPARAIEFKRVFGVEFPA